MIADHDVWQTHLASGVDGPSISGQRIPSTFAGEDSGPWTRSGILEGYSN